MSDAVIQKGTVILVGFGSFVYTGYVVDDGLTDTRVAEEAVIKDTNNATMTVFLSDPAQEIKFAAFILGTATVTPPIQGAGVSIVPPAGTATVYRTQSATVTYSRLAAKLDFGGRKESSMTYTTT